MEESLLESHASEASVARTGLRLIGSVKTDRQLSSPTFDLKGISSASLAENEPDPKILFVRYAEHVEHAFHEHLIYGTQKITVSLLGIRPEVWLFMNTISSDRGIRRWACWYEAFSVTLVLANVFVDVYASMDDIPDSAHIVMFQYGSCLVYMLEYCLRLWSCVEDPSIDARGLFHGRLTYALSFLPFIDLVVIISTVMMYFEPELAGLRTLRMVRLIRVLVILKLERNGHAVGRMLKVVRKKQTEIFATFFAAGVFLLMSATLMYNLEHDAQPEKFSSVINAMWWSAAALTTVGYGDVYPVTSEGKILGAIVAFFGMGIFSLPAGVLSSGFVEVLQEEELLMTQQDSSTAVRRTQSGATSNDVSTLQIAVEQMQTDIDELKRGQQEIIKLLQQKSHSGSWFDEVPC